MTLPLNSSLPPTRMWAARTSAPSPEQLRGTQSKFMRRAPPIKGMEKGIPDRKLPPKLKRQARKGFGGPTLDCFSQHTSALVTDCGCGLICTGSSVAAQPGPSPSPAPSPSSQTTADLTRRAGQAECQASPRDTSLVQDTAGEWARLPTVTPVQDTAQGMPSQDTAVQDMAVQDIAVQDSTMTAGRHWRGSQDTARMSQPENSQMTSNALQKLKIVIDFFFPLQKRQQTK